MAEYDDGMGLVVKEQMVDYDGGMGLFVKEQQEMAFLKETLRAQQNLLHKLYKELEAERESSSTAVQEALAMIERLQGEKAEVKMEAEQYKRLVEEKLSHAEESLSIFEDLMYQKELEVASLDYQVEAYRYKLMSMGITDLGIDDLKFQENEDESGSQNQTTPARKLCTTPTKFKFFSQKKGLNEREDPTSPYRELTSSMLEEREEKEWSERSSDNDLMTTNLPMTDINTYFEQIRRLDERVKEIAGVHLRSVRSSPSPLTLLKSGNSSDATRLVGRNENDRAKSYKNSSDNDSTGTPGVLDVFEVPQVDYDDIPQGKTVTFAAEDLIKQLDSIPDDALNAEAKKDIKWLNNLLVLAGVKKASSPRETALNCNKAIARPAARVIDVTPQKTIQQIRSPEITEVENHSIQPISSPKITEVENYSIQPTRSPKITEVDNHSIHQIKSPKIIEVGNHSIQQIRSPKITEVENHSSRDESGGKREELSLLSDIKEQLDNILSEVINLKTDHSVSQEKEAIVSYMETTLMEEMLQFWL